MSKKIMRVIRIAAIAGCIIAAGCAINTINHVYAQCLAVPPVDYSGEYPVDIKEHKASEKWESSISRIEKRYDGELPEVDCIFYGSSSIRKWKTLDEDMRKLKVLNHGFGGAKVPDCLYYADRMITAFKPRAVAFYAGTNDIGKGASAVETYYNTLKLFRYINQELPDTRIFYIAQTQQPDRQKYWTKMHMLNVMVKKYAKGNPMVTYINTEKKMNNEDGSPRTELFVEDGLHFNAQGYEEWSSVIRPVIYKKLAHDKKAEKKSAKKQSVEKPGIEKPYETESLKGNKLTK